MNSIQIQNGKTAIAELLNRWNGGKKTDERKTHHILFMAIDVRS